MSQPEIILGVTGGVAAYKAADLASKLVQSGYGVTSVLTKAAEKFIGKTTFEALTQRHVYTDLFSPQEHFLGEHIGLARHGQLVVIAPASADCLAKLAHGIGDDLLSTMCLATRSPILLAPAMNLEMWQKPAVQRNLEQLKADGLLVIGPGSGWQSCGEFGPGRMAEPVEILAEVKRLLPIS